MERSIDKRRKLSQDVLAYKITKDRKVFISWHGKQVTVLGGKKSACFIEDIKDAGNKEAQLIMAKATGHFKHGNERMNRSSY